MKYEKKSNKTAFAIGQKENVIEGGGVFQEFCNLPCSFVDNRWVCLARQHPENIKKKNTKNKNNNMA